MCVSVLSVCQQIPWGSDSINEFADGFVLQSKAGCMAGYSVMLDVLQLSQHCSFSPCLCGRLRGERSRWRFGHVLTNSKSANVHPHRVKRATIVGIVATVLLLCARAVQSMVTWVAGMKGTCVGCTCTEVARRTMNTGDQLQQHEVTQHLQP